MGSLSAPAPFTVLTDAQPDNTSLPAFMVSTTRGFLPRMEPVVELPPVFAKVESLLNAVGEPGLLAHGQFGDAVLAELEDLTEAVDAHKDDLVLQNALYRDYSFMASAYLLEPCHMRFLKGEGYGLARDRLPAALARPIARSAELCGFKPFMEYAGSYALFNYKLMDPARGLAYDNLRLIRAFEHGLDPTSSEAGFVLTHVAMVSHSGALVEGVVNSLAAASSTAPSSSRRTSFNAGLQSILGALLKVNGAMEGMWDVSKPRSYTSFRTFIFGITSQSMFPHGVVYEGIGDDDAPQSFRGESGANDSMIPLMDNFLGIAMPNTPLTAILKDFRSYRPGNHREFLEWVAHEQARCGLREYALSAATTPADADHAEVLESRRLWLKIQNQVRDFRWRHWCFAREYILKQTTHPTATGGSPIVTWLPNQLLAVMEDMIEMHKLIGGSDGGLGIECEDIMEQVQRQRDTLNKEVAKYCAERGVTR
ncbi:indoleamine 2-3-dioxygenase family protein [Apiospora phragmitis]|uniref:Indoleamine 2-3-dioxygenase family protein n=1 Tax=Apiospora phragmitis TaxID=2905665 RepID=A0ABR1VGM2_9PEZI